MQIVIVQQGTGMIEQTLGPPAPLIGHDPAEAELEQSQ
jgi:hypothetical protein